MFLISLPDTCALQEDSYIQYTSSGPREGDLLQRLETQQREANLEPLTMRCFDSFATKDDAGKEMKLGKVTGAMSLVGWIWHASLNGGGGGGGGTCCRLRCPPWTRTV